MEGVLKLAKSIACVALITYLAIWAIGAQGSAAEGPRDMIEAYRIWKLTETLDLSEDEMPAFFSKLQQLEEKRQDLGKREQEAIEDIAHVLGREEVDEVDLAKALNRYDQIRRKRIDELEGLRQEALSMLTARQRCQFIVFEERFRKEIRHMIERVRDMRGRDEVERERDMGRRDDAGRMRRPGGSGTGRGRR
jgi:Rad3-related DNA helicase